MAPIGRTLMLLRPEQLAQHVAHLDSSAEDSARRVCSMDFIRGARYLVTGRLLTILNGTFEATYTGRLDQLDGPYHNFKLVYHPLIAGLRESEIGPGKDFDVQPSEA